MTQIKVGQVWKHNDDIFVITKAYYAEPDDVYEETYYHIIFNNGEIDYENDGFFLSCKLLATYPTWQEAVNSKEFKGE